MYNKSVAYTRWKYWLVLYRKIKEQRGDEECFFFKSYLNICKDLILYWIICESIDFYKESKKNKINIINFLIYDIITDFILSIIIYSIIYFFKISLLQFMIAVVVGVLFVFMLLTKFSEKDILLKGVILTLALFIMTYWI